MRLHVRTVYHQPLKVGIVDEYSQKLLPDALVAPADEAPVRVAPAPVFGWQVTPGRPRAQHPHHRIDEPAVVFGDAAPVPSFSGEVRFQFFPNVVKEVMSVQCVFHTRVVSQNSGNLSRKSCDYAL